MRFFTVWLAVALAGSGCGKKNAEKTATKDSPAEATPAQPKNISELFAEKPSLVGPFADVVLGETELSSLDPKYVGEAKGEFSGFPAKFFATDFAMHYPLGKGKVNEVNISVGNDVDAIGAMSKAWGAPVKAPDTSGAKLDGKRRPALYWFNRETGLRVRAVETANTQTINFARYLPFEQFLGEDGSAVFGFETKLPLLGAKVQAVVDAYPGQVDTKAGRLLFPQTEFDSFSTQIKYREKAGVVTEVRFHLQYEVAAEGDDRRAAILNAFSTKFGAEKNKHRLKGDQSWVFSEKPFVELKEGPGPWFDVVVLPVEIKKKKGTGN